MRCGTPYGLARHAYRLGARQLDLPFCPACWRRYVTARQIFAVAAAVAALAVAGGAVVTVMTRSYLPAAVGALVGLPTLAAAYFHLRASRPRRVPGGIDVPGIGHVEIGDSRE